MNEKRTIDSGRRFVEAAADPLPIVEFLRIHAGEDSLFVAEARAAGNFVEAGEHLARVKRMATQWLDLAEAGLAGRPGERLDARIDSANDLLEQVQRLIDDSEVHPAAPIMLAGAGLEQALRGLAEAEGLTVTKPGIGSYGSALRSASVISAQNFKDITSWAGLRNSAAHGRFEDVSRESARLMMLGINLFSPGGRSRLRSC